MTDAGPSMETFTVAILGPGGRRAGLGALVGPRHVVTCAHVVNTALGLDQRGQDQPDGLVVRIIFPLLDSARSRILTARVVMWQAPPPRSGAAGDDVAGLIVEGDLPGSARPGRLATAPGPGVPVQVFGYSADPPRPDGGLASAIVRGPVPGGRLQLDRHPGSALRVQQGFSGSPVFDQSAGRIVGLVAQADPNPSTADSYAVGSGLLWKLWPEVLGEPASLLLRESHRGDPSQHQERLHHRHQQQPPQPPDYRPWPRGRWSRRPAYLRTWAIWGIAALMVMGIAASTWSGPGGNAPHRQPPHKTRPTPKPSPRPRVVKATKPTVPAVRHITYIATGSGSANVTYGPSGSTLTGAVPMHVTAQLGNESAYYVRVQLNGGDGSVTVEVAVDGKIISKGTADVSYGTALAQICQGSTSNQWEECN